MSRGRTATRRSADALARHSRAMPSASAFGRPLRPMGHLQYVYFPGLELSVPEADRDYVRRTECVADCPATSGDQRCHLQSLLTSAGTGLPYLRYPVSIAFFHEWAISHGDPGLAAPVSGRIDFAKAVRRGA